MGLLDDAIREHLELKRRRGADTAEIARLEHEAFGPVRRGAEPVTLDPEPPAGAPHLQLAEDPIGAVRVDELEVQHEPPRPHGDPADALPHAAVREPSVHEPEDELFAEDDGLSLDGLPAVDDPVGQPTRAFDPDEVRAATEAARGAAPADDDEAEDVLEETPEFLQETPEHDRLWFEQRPPRDFDF